MISRSEVLGERGSLWNGALAVSSLSGYCSYAVLPLKYTATSMDIRLAAIFPSYVILIDLFREDEH